MNKKKFTSNDIDNILKDAFATEETKRLLQILLNLEQHEQAAAALAARHYIEAQTKTPELAKYRIYSLSELEPIIGKTRQTLLRYIASGKLKAVKVGQGWKVTEESLKEFLAG